MRWIPLTALGMLAALAAGCADWHTQCGWRCGEREHQSSPLVEFLYPDGVLPPVAREVPPLRVPLRVGLAFLPARATGSEPLDPALKEQLLERIRARFLARHFIAEIVPIPDYYLASARGFQGLAAVDRLYGVDVMALVSYDQITYAQDNALSLGYLTIVGAYVIKGSRHDVTTLVDLAVVDASSRRLILRAGGTDTRHGNTTLVDEARETRGTARESFQQATDDMIGHFDTALTDLEQRVREGSASIQVTGRDGRPVGGGGAIDAFELIALAAIAYRRSRRHLYSLKDPEPHLLRLEEAACAGALQQREG